MTEIDIKQCLIDSYFIPSVGTLCGPSTTKEQDSLKGKWVQVDRNLNFQGYSFVVSLLPKLHSSPQITCESQNVYYRRTRRLDIPLITDIRILPEKETPSPFSSQWSKVSRPVSPRGETLYLWYYKNKTLSEMSNAEKQNNLITEIDVTYGDSDAWYGFEKLERPVASKDEGKKLESVWLTTRKGVQRTFLMHMSSACSDNNST